MHRCSKLYQVAQPGTTWKVSPDKHWVTSSVSRKVTPWHSLLKKNALKEFKFTILIYSSKPEENKKVAPSLGLPNSTLSLPLGGRLLLWVQSKSFVKSCLCALKNSSAKATQALNNLTPMNIRFQILNCVVQLALREIWPS